MTSNILRVFLGLSLCGLCVAKSSGPIQRGGIGFLYSDNNNFTNPGLFGGARAFSMDAKFDTVSTGTAKSVSTSVVYGTGAVGIGAFGQRAGSNLTTSGGYTDTAGVGLGLAVAKGKALFGAGYRRGVSTGQTNDGRVEATLTTKSGDKGFAFGMGVTTELNSAGDETKTGTVALGYGFGGGIGFEVNGVLNDFANNKNMTGAAYITKSAQTAFMSVGYVWNNVSSKHGVAARLGFVFGKSVDVSIYGSHTFVSDENPSYGGSLRFVM